MVKILAAGIISLITCLIIGPLLIPVLRRMKFGQTVRTDGPESHLEKQGTPTMGGIIFFFSLTLGIIFFVKGNLLAIILLIFTLAFGLIGFTDDFIKIVKKRSLGLKARAKILGQFILALILVWISINYLGRGTDLIIPLTGAQIDLGIFYLPFAILVVMGSSNAVNLTDGLDGLATGVTMFVALSFVVIGYSQGLLGIPIFAMALVGSCLGFLVFNIHPAKLFMGDTGSLALGGAIGALAVITKTELLLLVLGFVYVIETVSVILQVASFKLTKKRIFLMSPLHHHYELKGWPERKVVLTFWLLAIISVLLGLLIYYYTYM